MIETKDTPTEVAPFLQQPPRDRTGREIRPGDTIVYAVRPGWMTNPELRIAKVLAVVNRPIKRATWTGSTCEWVDTGRTYTKLAVHWGGMIPGRAYLTRYRHALVLCGGVI